MPRRSGNLRSRGHGLRSRRNRGRRARGRSSALRRSPVAPAGRPRMNAPEEALSILCAEHEASLGTVEDGKPYVSAVGYVYRPASEGGLGRLYLLLSDLARHSKNLARSSQASLLILE